VALFVQGIIDVSGSPARIPVGYRPGGTRVSLGGSFFGGYAAAVGNLDGWGDGDPFLINYVGHPMQGAISGNIWIHNDPRYRRAEIGKNRHYWAGPAARCGVCLGLQRTV
jgi:hypothetical protein